MMTGDRELNAEIISVGTELLLGDILNSNTQWLCKELALLGINVFRTTCIGDNEVRLLKAIGDAFTEADIVITTGGLGPTDDDLTKETAARYFKKELVIHEPSRLNLDRYFIKKPDEIRNKNLKQAFFPVDSIIMENPYGTAPGCIMESEEGKVIIVLPGPPREMKPMFENHVRNFLGRFGDGVMISRIVRISAIGESEIAYRIDDMLKSQTNPTIAPYAKDNEVILRITAKAKNEAEAELLLLPVVEELEKRFGETIYAFGETLLEEELSKLLKRNGKTLSIAESCTGGTVSSMIVSVPGASEILKESIVCYGIDSKINRCGVKKCTIDSHGLYSETVTQEMASGIREITGSDFSIATNGIAGPDDENGEKAGTVFIAIDDGDSCDVKKYEFAGDRSKVIRRASYNALNDLRLNILKKCEMHDA